MRRIISEFNRLVWVFVKYKQNFVINISSPPAFKWLIITMIFQTLLTVQSVTPRVYDENIFMLLQFKALHQLIRKRNHVPLMFLCVIIKQPLLGSGDSVDEVLS